MYNKEVIDDITLVTLENEEIKVKFISYGAAIKELYTKDYNGNFGNIVLGYSTLERYKVPSTCYGATIGPNSGRITGGRMVIDGKVIELEKNYLGVSNSHGYPYGFLKENFVVDTLEENKVVFHLHRLENEYFPGDIDVYVTYELCGNKLVMTYDAESTKDTILNMTNHSYFNLSGDVKNNILDHQMILNASRYIRIDEYMNKVAYDEVEGTPFDFKSLKSVGPSVEKIKELGIMTNGIDHVFLLDKNNESDIFIQDPVSLRTMTIKTTYPCVVCYTYNKSKGEDMINGNKANNHDGICFECQYEPNSINENITGSSYLKKGEKYHHVTTYEFN